MTKWTDEQLDAINSSGENIIVSAGAGSGKTAVLTERVITKLRQGININQLLVLTFTNAAAKEMKERIRKAIKKEPNLKEMLDYIDSAYITTFDSFSLSIVKKYHYLLGITRNVGIVEASIIELIKKQLLEDIMDEEYLQAQPDFSKLITDFCLKDDKNIADAIIDMYKHVTLIYDYQTYLNDYLDNHYNDVKIDSDIKNYEKLIISKITYIKELLEEVNRIDGEYYNKLITELNNLLNGNNYEDIKVAVNNIKYPRLKSGSSDELKLVNNKISSVVKEIKNLTNYENTDAIKKSIYLTKDYVSSIIRIILKLDNKIADYKKKYDLYEFNDIALMAIKLVKDNIDVRNEVKNTFHEILVDEYQDTSDLQELFISLISDNNVYMVGDVKQSIYRFRNANPDIFRNKYNDYRIHNGGKKIDLNKNFRSRNTVLDNINDIFNLIMDDKVGGANYSLEHQLIFGNKSYVTCGTTEQDMNMEIYNYKLDKDYEYDKSEVEAFLIAQDIASKVKNKYQVFDKDSGKLRDITYGDFAILINKSRDFELYKKIFTYLGIPISINKDGKLTDAPLIMIIKNILKLLISDTDFNHAYASVARSFLFEVSDTEIFDRITNNDFTDDVVMAKINLIKERINSLSNSEILDLIIKDFNIYEKLIMIGDINENIIRLDYLADLASNLSLIGYDIYDFTKYIDDIFTSDLEILYDAKDTTSDSVKIMTIHKSKGLEFYICYFPALNNKFNLDDLKDRFNFYNSFGFITPYYQNGIRRTIYTDLLKEQYLNEAISEQLRLFYVALTRAKEKIILIGEIEQTGNDYRNKLVPDVIRNDYRSFADILSSVSDKIKSYVKNIDITKLNITKDYQVNTKDLNFNFNSNEEIEVTDLNISDKAIEETVFSHHTNNLKTYEEVLVLNAGNYLHQILETIDLKHPNLNELNISDVEKNQIKLFLNQDILDDIMNANIYQEYEFIDSVNHRHGIIDLMLEYEDKIKIIDYKLQNIDNPNYIEQLNGYKDYISNKTGKPVKVYLYSILKGVYKEV